MNDTTAEVKASSPIRTSLFEREGSMWGRLKRPSLRHPSVIPSLPMDLFPYSFKTLRKLYNIPEPSRTDMVDDCRADDSDFCLEVVERGLLTEEQMHHAAERYRLGKSRSGKTIYWMIDDLGICRDGHIGSSSHAADTWVSTLLKRRYPDLAQYIPPSKHCLFGLHLLGSTGSPTAQPLSQSKGLALVESERSAMILSELYPNLLWLATAYPANATVDQLEPLQGHPITLFPRTDDTMSTYLSWVDLADHAERLYHLDITVDDTLEKHATPEQKARCIDLVDFISDNS